MNWLEEHKWHLDVGYNLDKMDCQNCDEYTDHICRHSDHERDSSRDHFICLKCGWEYYGYTGEYEPPMN